MDWRFIPTMNEPLSAHLRGIRQERPRAGLGSWCMLNAMANAELNTEPVWVTIQDTLETMQVPWNTPIRFKGSKVREWRYLHVGALRDHPEGFEKFFHNIEISLPAGRWGTFSITSEPQVMTVNMTVRVRVNSTLDAETVERTFRNRIPERLTEALVVTDVQVAVVQPNRNQPSSGLIEEFWGADHPYLDTKEAPDGDH